MCVESAIELSQAKEQWIEYTQIHKVPEAIVVEITNACNCAECDHCYMDAKSVGEGLLMAPRTSRMWLKAISGLELKPEFLWISGGEPTVHPWVGTFLGQAREFGFRAVLVTNGERFADNEYCQRVSPWCDEIEVSVRGMGVLHDLMMLPSSHPLWSLVPRSLSPSRQLECIVHEVSKSYIAEHFQRTVSGLQNITNTKPQDSSPKINLNIDIHARPDLLEICNYLLERGVRVNSIWLQVQQKIGRAARSSVSIPNLWRTPTVEVVEEYARQCQLLLCEGKVMGETVIIDPLPEDIVSTLEFESEEKGWIYKPIATPVITVDGKLLYNVVNRGV